MLSLFSLLETEGRWVANQAPQAGSQPAPMQTPFGGWPGFSRNMGAPNTHCFASSTEMQQEAYFNNLLKM